jgi:hypothetical protein
MNQFLEQTYSLLIGMIQPILLVTGAVVWFAVAILFTRVLYELAKSVVITIDAIKWIRKCGKVHGKQLRHRDILKCFWRLFKDIAGASDGSISISTMYGKWAGYRKWVVYPPEGL